MAPRTGAIRTLYNQKLSEQPSSGFISKNGKKVAALPWMRLGGRASPGEVVDARKWLFLTRSSTSSFSVSSGLLRVLVFGPTSFAFPEVFLSPVFHPRSLERKSEELSESEHEKTEGEFVTGPNC